MHVPWTLQSSQSIQASPATIAFLVGSVSKLQSTQSIQPSPATIAFFVRLCADTPPTPTPTPAPWSLQYHTPTTPDVVMLTVHSRACRPGRAAPLRAPRHHGLVLPAAAVRGTREVSTLFIVMPLIYAAHVGFMGRRKKKKKMMMMT